MCCAKFKVYVTAWVELHFSEIFLCRDVWDFSARERNIFSRSARDSTIKYSP